MCLQKLITAIILSNCCSFVICDKYDYYVSENINLTQNIFEREKRIFTEIGKLYKLLHDKIDLVNTTMKQQVTVKERRFKFSTVVFSKLVSFLTTALRSVGNKELESSSSTKPDARKLLSLAKVNECRTRINKNITKSLTFFSEWANDAVLGVINGGQSGCDFIYSGSEQVRSVLKPYKLGSMIWLQ